VSEVVNGFLILNRTLTLFGDPFFGVPGTEVRY